MLTSIDRGIPPPTSLRPGRPRKLPYVECQIGDSFFTEWAPNVTHMRRATGFEFVQRHVVEGDRTGWRTWRIA